jgi:hypothetical protein
MGGAARLDFLMPKVEGLGVAGRYAMRSKELLFLSHKK